MKIGIVSDSHKKIELLKDAIDRLKLDGAEFLIHAGDIVLEESLMLLEDSNLPYQAVIGNNDIHLIGVMRKYNLFKEPHYFKIEDIKVKLMHLPYYLNNDTDIIVYGHTHHFFAEIKEGSLYINPGEICARKKPISEFALVEKTKESWSVIHYQKEIFRDKEYIAKRVFGDND